MVQVRYRLPRAEQTELVGDARIGVPKPIQPPFQVKVLCAYKYRQNDVEGSGCVLITVRSSRAILSAFAEAIEIVLADWKESRGPRPKSISLLWYMPENGKGKF